MKSSEEMVNNLLVRRGRYLNKQKKKKLIIIRILTSMCCICLIALLGLNIWQDRISNITTPNQITKDISNQIIGNNNKIVLNNINGIFSDKKNINLMINDYIEMSREEMVEYYGVDYIPDVPADIKPWNDEQSGIYKRNGGTGEVYYDADILNYSNEDFTRNVHIEVDKGSYVSQDYLFFNGTEEESIINNFKVIIGYSDNGYYYSEFIYKEVGFCINANGVTEDEFVSIISSIIK